MTNATESIPGLEIRFTLESDVDYLKNWLVEPGMNRCFPMANKAEVDDSARRWISFSGYKASLTAVYEGVPCGIATLYIMPYEKLRHQSEFGIILTASCRRMKIGSILMEAITDLAKDNFNIELLHLQVFESNGRGIEFFKELGFKEFGRQTHWLKDRDKYRARIFMERFI